MPKKKTRTTARIVKEPQIADRLKELQQDWSLRAFAARCRINHRRLTHWLSGENAPDADNLRRIATATGVSIDWLLGMPNAPAFRKGDRSPAALHADLAAYVEQEINAIEPPSIDGIPYSWRVSGRAVLAAAVDAAKAAAGAEIDRERYRRFADRESQALLEAVHALSEQARLEKNSSRRAEMSERIDVVLAATEKLLTRHTDARSTESLVLLVPAQPSLFSLGEAESSRTAP